MLEDNTSTPEESNNREKDMLFFADDFTLEEATANLSKTTGRSLGTTNSDFISLLSDMPKNQNMLMIQKRMMIYMKLE